jgi:hypothetical protein
MVQGHAALLVAFRRAAHDDLGNFEGFHGVASDVTEQRKPSEDRLSGAL